jgi:hypothetical protein
MDAVFLFLIISGVFTLVMIAVISLINLVSTQRTKQANKVIEDYMTDLKKMQKRVESDQDVQKSSLQLNITERDEYNGFPALIRAVKYHLDFEKWGFEIIHSGKLLNHSGMILQSEYCKVKILTWRDRPYEEPGVYFSYGRLHALNEDYLTTWNGEKCYCWHGIQEVSNFLDGLTAQETIQNRRGSAFMYDFYEKNKFRGWSHPEMEVKKQAAAWEHYGQNLFNLFDLRHPELWQKYSTFYKELYDLRVTYPDHSITPDYKIC